LHPGAWEKVVDALFWLQLAWIFSGFLLMAYLALKVFPSDKRGKNPQTNSEAPNAQKPELITLGNYRFEIPAGTLRSRTNVIELYRKQSEPDSGLR